MLKAVLFDLDGTLLPMDQDRFTGGYLKLLAKKLIPCGYEQGKLIDSIWYGTKAMVRNDGSRTNEEAFWHAFESIYGSKCREDEDVFMEFYSVDFEQARDLCGYDPRAAQAVHTIRDSGCRVALATNPLFPAAATQRRIRWAGLEPEDFELYTTFENIGYCKPNLEYYREVLRRMALSPEECLMVGNDTDEDMVAEQLGMKVFLLTDSLLNRSGADIGRWPHGSYDALLRTWRALADAG